MNKSTGSSSAGKGGKPSGGSNAGGQRSSRFVGGEADTIVTPAPTKSAAAPKPTGSSKSGKK